MSLSTDASKLTKLKVRVYALAIDIQASTQAECFATLAEAWSHIAALLLDGVEGGEETETKARKFIELSRWDALDKLLAPFAESDSCTWQIYPAEFELGSLEIVSSP